MEGTGISIGKQDETPQVLHKKWEWGTLSFMETESWFPLAYLFIPSLSEKECKRPDSSNLFKIRYTVVLFNLF